MTTTSQGRSRPDTNKIRSTVQEVLSKARQDPKYKEQLFTDPVSTLKQAGLGQQEADHLVAYELTWGFSAQATKGQSVQQPGDISPLLFCWATCDFWTCIITSCTWFTGV